MLKVPRLMLKAARRARPARARAAAARGFSTSSKLDSPRKLAHLKKLQADYQCEDGRPIFLKSGFMDRVLYTTTLVLVVVGLCNVLVVLYDHAKPENWKKAC